MAEIKNFPNNVDEYIGAQNVMKWLHGRTSGVFGADGNLSVTANDDMTVSVSDGDGWLANDKADGTAFWNDTKEQTGSELQLEIPLADPILPRIDRIVVSWDTVDYAAKPRIEVLKGTAASTPAAPALTNNGLLRQISLAQISVAAAASKIAASDITDERLDADVCGLVTDWISVDTAPMQAQFEDLLQKVKTELNRLNAGTEAMLRTTYDQQGKNTDVFAYTDGKSAAILKKVEPLTSANAGAHNAIYRGKFLGNRVTDEQYAAIKAGTFDDLYIGDYWTINGMDYTITNYRIGALDYYLNSGDKACTDHHVVIVPDTCLYNAVMNSTNTTAGGYVGSAMYKSNLEQAKTIIKSAFSGHVLKHRIYLTNAVSNGRASGYALCDSEVDLMCEQMVYGSGIFHPVSDGSNVPANQCVEKSQLPLFQHEPSRICNRATWWLRDVINVSGFAFVDYDSHAGYYSASNSLGVRPFFCIY